MMSSLNPIWKMVAKNLSKGCQRCGRPILISIFDAYVTGERPDCLSCSAAYVSTPLIKHVFSNTNLREDDLKKIMDDMLLRRSMLNVVRGISHFGLRKPQPTAVPVVIVWNITNRCNLNCIHCHQDSGLGKGEEELTTEGKFKVIERMGKAGVSILTFSGGEPLVYPQIIDAIKLADDCGMLCTIASNGALMTKQVVGKLKDAGIKRVEIGLDGCRADTHEFLRNAPGCFEATIQGIKNCAEAGFDELCTTMTLHSKNVNELSETMSLAEKLGAHRFYINRLIPAGRGKSVIDLDITREQKIDALESANAKFYKSAAKGEGIQCYCRGMTYYGRLGYERSNGEVFTVSEALSGYSRMWYKFGDGVAEIIRKFASGFGGCSAGITYAGLTAGGDLLPCVPAPMKLVNLLEEDLEGIWINNELLNYVRQRDKLQGACGICEYNSICGGCRYTAYAVNGDWLAADPSCPFGPKCSGN